MDSDNSKAAMPDTVVVGAGQAGLAASYWLSREGVEHAVLDQRATLGGGWLDRWDGFYLNTPNFSLQLPGMPYDGPAPDAFMSRDEVIAYIRRYARASGAPVRTGTRVTRVGPSTAGFRIETDQGAWAARNVVLATGAFQKPKIPPVSAAIPKHVLQLHTNDYRSPARLPDGAVLVVGTGQSGGQIAEELCQAGRDVHLAVSTCPEAPRRYRGQDLVYWLMQVGMHGAEVGVSFPAPPPAGRFACNPLLTGAHGGRDIHLRDLARQGITLHGRLEAAEDGVLLFSDDFPERLRMVEAGFGQRLQPVIDAYIAAARIDAPPPGPPRGEEPLPEAPARLDLKAGNVSCIIWATGFKLDFSLLDFPVVDEWGYPRHRAGVTEQPGLYVVGLPWLTGQPSSLLSGVGRDAADIARHLAAHTAQSGNPPGTIPV